MTRFSRWLFLVCLAVGMTMAACPSYATPPLPPPSAWPPKGLTVVDQPGTQFTSDIIPDGLGGAFVAWTDKRGDEQTIDVYLQRVTATGQIAWVSAGVPVCTEAGRQFLIRLAPDGNGGVIASWYDERGVSPDIYALHVGNDGNVGPGWPAGGLPVCAAQGTQIGPVIATDGNGGAYVAWEDERDGNANTHVYVQRITGSGAPEPGWPSDGIRVSNSAGFEFEPAITARAEGGVFVTWVRGSPYGVPGDIVTTLITPSGSVAPGWPDSGLVISTAPGHQDLPSTISDQQGGLYAVWRDYRDEVDISGENRSDVYAQRVTGSGQFPVGWGGDGLAVRVDTTDQWIPKIAADGLGGVLISWWNVPEIFVQRITPEGTVAPGWNAAGVSAGTITATGQGPALAGDGAGGAFVAWNDYRGPSALDVYAQRIGANGERASGWPAGGSQVSSGIGQEQVGGGEARVSTMVGDGRGGALVAWIDFDAPNYGDIKIQRVTSSGVIGPRDCYGCNAIETLSPNPGNGHFRVGARVPTFDTAAILDVHDVRGRKVRTMTYEGLQPGGMANLDLDLSGLPAGVYFLRLTGGSDMLTLGSRRVVLVR